MIGSPFCKAIVIYVHRHISTLIHIHMTAMEMSHSDLPSGENLLAEGLQQQHRSWDHALSRQPPANDWAWWVWSFLPSIALGNLCAGALCCVGQNSGSEALPIQSSFLLPLLSQVLDGHHNLWPLSPTPSPSPLYISQVTFWRNHLNCNSVLAFASQGTVTGFDVLLRVCHAFPIFVN